MKRELIRIERFACTLKLVILISRNQNNDYANKLVNDWVLHAAGSPGPAHADSVFVCTDGS